MNGWTSIRAGTSLLRVVVPGSDCEYARSARGRPDYGPRQAFITPSCLHVPRATPPRACRAPALARAALQRVHDLARRPRRAGLSARPSQATGVWPQNLGVRAPESLRGPVGAPGCRRARLPTVRVAAVRQPVPPDDDPAEQDATPPSRVGEAERAQGSGHQASVGAPRPADTGGACGRARRLTLGRVPRRPRSHVEACPACSMKGAPQRRRGLRWRLKPTACSARCGALAVRQS